MKRSEMIEFIRWFIEDQQTEDTIEDASDLLGHIEELGMLPPDIFSEGCEFECNAVYEWEEE